VRPDLRSLLVCLYERCGYVSGFHRRPYTRLGSPEFFVQRSEFWHASFIAQADLRLDKGGQALLRFLPEAIERQILTVAKLRCFGGVDRKKRIL
jgi:hypothetical protein